MTANGRTATLEVIGPALVLACLVLLDALLPPSVVVSSAFAIAAFVAAAVTTPARTAVMTVAATVMVVVSSTWDHDLENVDWWVRLLLTGLFGAFAVLLADIRERRERALRHMTVVAETAQHALLRGLPDRVGPVALAARYVSATEAALIGGDLYDVADTPYGVRIVVGDVRGKGLDAVHLASTVLAAFRRAAFRQPTLAAVAAELDAAVTSVSGEEDFVTAVLAEYHDDGTATVVNCGHHPPLLVFDHTPPAPVDTGEPALPLGLGSAPQAATVSWPDRSRMLLYTDGLVETRNHRGAFFPLHEHAPELGQGDLDEALDGLLGRLSEFGARQSDDMALVLAEHRAQAVAD